MGHQVAMSMQVHALNEFEGEGLGKACHRAAFSLGVVIST